MSLFDSCVMVALRTGKPSFSRKDKAKTAKLLAESGASSHEAARVSKALFPDSQYLKDIAAHDMRCRVFLEKHSSAWTSPFRILLASKYPEVRHELDVMLADRAPLVATFIANYEDAIDEARNGLGDMFDASDYLPVDIVARKFYLKLEVQALPANDWRVQAADESDDRLRDAIQASSMEMYKNVLVDHYTKLWDSLTDSAGKLLTDRLYDMKATLTESTITGVKAQCDLLAELNITDDPELAGFTDKFSEIFSRYNIETLRHDPMARRQVADDARQVIESAEFQAKLDGFQEKIDDFLG